MYAINVTINVVQIELSTATFEFLKEVRRWRYMEITQISSGLTVEHKPGLSNGRPFHTVASNKKFFQHRCDWFRVHSESETDLLTWQLNLAVEVQPSA